MPAEHNDGEIILPIDPISEEEEKTMAEPIDLSPNVANMIMTETAGNLQANNREGRDSASAAQAQLRFTAVQNFGELGAIESRANSGILATPIATPTTQG